MRRYCLGRRNWYPHVRPCPFRGSFPCTPPPTENSWSAKWRGRRCYGCGRGFTSTATPSVTATVAALTDATVLKEMAWLSACRQATLLYHTISSENRSHRSFFPPKIPNIDNLYRNTETFCHKSGILTANKKIREA